jgi:hypothetical protein
MDLLAVEWFWWRNGKKFSMLYQKVTHNAKVLIGGSG